MKQAYIERNFTNESQRLIALIDDICRNYMSQGYVLTVRQLYYQLVARNIIPNTERSYKNTTSLVNDARLAGLVDWSAIEDRTREFQERPHWRDGAQFMSSVAPQFFADMWEDQQTRVFCIVEKEALAGVLSGICNEWDVPMMAARGYPSVSVLRQFARQMLLPAIHAGQDCVILHLGDHDPSGIDMTRDLGERIKMLADFEPFTIDRIALNMPQIEEKNCPPNPAKLTDSRAGGYVSRFGYDSWELDALEPSYLVNLVRSHIEGYIDPDLWKRKEEFIEDTRGRLEELAGEFE